MAIKLPKGFFQFTTLDIVRIDNEEKIKGIGDIKALFIKLFDDLQKLSAYLSAETGGIVYEEEDPIFMASPAAGISEEDINNWNSEEDPIFMASPAALITLDDILNWDTAYGWGDHSLAGYLKQDGSTPLTGPWAVGSYDIIGIETLGFEEIQDCDGLVQSDEFWSEEGGSDIRVMSEKAIFDAIDDLMKDIGACYGWEWHLVPSMQMGTGGNHIYVTSSDGDEATGDHPNDFEEKLLYYLPGLPCDSIKVIGQAAEVPVYLVLEAWYGDQWHTIHNGTTGIPDMTWTTINFTECAPSVIKLTNGAQGGHYFNVLREIRFHLFGLRSSGIGDL